MSLLRFISAVVLISPFCYGQSKEVMRETKISMKDFNYHCSVRDANGHVIIGPREISMSRSGDPIPAKPFSKTQGGNLVSWSVTRFASKVVADVRDSQNQIVASFTVEEGQPIAIEVPGVSSLDCSAPKLALNDRFNFGENYICKAASYVSTQSKETNLLYERKVSGRDDFSLLEGSARVSISFRQDKSTTELQLRDSAGRLIATSRTAPKQDMALQIPGSKILTKCNLEGGSGFEFNPQTHGESMRFDPQTHGSYIQLHKAPTRRSRVTR